MGLIVNQPTLDISFADILRSADIPVPESSLPPVYLGGPVEMNTAFLLYSSDYTTDNQMIVSPTVSLSSDPQILKDISLQEGPQYFIFAIGYAGWAPGQLENELSVNGWLTLPAEDEVLFRTPDELKWKRAAKMYGIDITTFDDVIGTA